MAIDHIAFNGLNSLSQIWTQTQDCPITNISSRVSFRWVTFLPVNLKMIFRKSITKYANWGENVSHQITVYHITHRQMLLWTAYLKGQVEWTYCKGTKFQIFILVCTLHDEIMESFNTVTYFNLTWFISIYRM